MPHLHQGKTSWKHQLEYSIFRFSEVVLRLLPARFVDFSGRLLGSLAWHLAVGLRRVVWRNIMVAWGETSTDEELKILSKKIFQQNVANMLGAIRSSVMPLEKMQKFVELEGAEEFGESLLTEKKGAILVLAHMGNWEILARLSQLVPAGVTCGAMYRPLNNPLVDGLVKKRRQDSGTKLFAKKEGFAEAIQLLRSGGALGILSDQHAGNSGELCPFYGRLTSCSPLPSLLQRRTGAAVFHAAVMRTGPARWKVKIFRHSENPVSTASIMRGIEATINLSPADGFWFHERWKLPHKKPLGLQNRRGARSLNDRSQQILVVMSDDTLLREQSLPALQALVNARPNLRFYLTVPAPIVGEQRVFFLNPADSMTTSLQSWEKVNRLPLDMILVLDRPQRHRDLNAPVVAGFGHQKHFTHGVKAEPEIYDTQAWFSLLAQLGFSPAEQLPE